MRWQAFKLRNKKFAQEGEDLMQCLCGERQEKISNQIIYLFQLMRVIVTVKRGDGNVKVWNWFWCSLIQGKDMDFPAG